jgi:hypothetical protein
VYRFVYLLPTWCYFLWNLKIPVSRCPRSRGSFTLDKAVPLRISGGFDPFRDCTASECAGRLHLRCRAHGATATPAAVHHLGAGGLERTAGSADRRAAPLVNQPSERGAGPRGGLCPTFRGQGPVSGLSRVLFVLTGASRSRLKNRMSDLQAMVAQHPLVTVLAREVRLGAAVLEDIEQHGPAQTVWVPLAGGKPRPWTDL